MKRYLHVFLLGALVLAFAFDALVWSAATQLPGIGRDLRAGARREAALTYLYMVAGTPLRALGPLADYGHAYASDAFRPVAAEIVQKPEVAMELAHKRSSNRRHSTLMFMHYAPLVLLVAWGLAFWRRPRAVHLVGRR
jgi:hypothetical protein